MAYMRNGLIAVIVSAGISGTAGAEPIYLQESTVPKPGQFLTVEQLAILDSLTDHGWHLGWFKNDHGVFLPDELFPDSSLNTVAVQDGVDMINLPETAILPGAGSPFAPNLSPGPDSLAQLTPIPEPATIVLLGSGLIAGLVRRRLLQKVPE